MCILRGSEANTLVSRIKDSVKALKESQTVDEVQTLSTGCSKIGHDKIDIASHATNVGVESTGPNLSISSEFIGFLMPID